MLTAPRVLQSCVSALYVGRVFAPAGGTSRGWVFAQFHAFLKEARSCKGVRDGLGGALVGKWMEVCQENAGCLEPFVGKVRWHGPLAWEGRWHESFARGSQVA